MKLFKLILIFELCQLSLARIRTSDAISPVTNRQLTAADQSTINQIAANRKLKHLQNNRKLQAGLAVGALTGIPGAVFLGHNLKVVSRNKEMLKAKLEGQAQDIKNKIRLRNNELTELAKKIEYASNNFQEYNERLDEGLSIFNEGVRTKMRSKSER